MFECLVYGKGGGVMFELREGGETSTEVAERVAERFRDYPQAAKVGAWPVERDQRPAQVNV